MANTLQQDGDFTSLVAECINCHKSDHAVYEFEIRCINQDIKWKISKRYSEFFNLHKKLCKLDASVKNISFPPKRAFNNLTPILLIERKSKLQSYLNDLFNKFSIPPHPLSKFIDWYLYDIHGITGYLARKFFESADIILGQNMQFEFNVLQIYAINERLKSQSPTNLYDEVCYDFTHVMDFISKLNSLKITVCNKMYHSSNIIMNKLEFDLCRFSSLKKLELIGVNLKMLRGVENLKHSLFSLKVSLSLNEIKTLAMGDLLSIGNGDWVFGRDTVPTSNWASLTTLDLSNNFLSALDPSMALFSCVSVVILKNNLLSNVEQLSSLVNLHRIDLSDNNLGSTYLSTGPSLRGHLGNVTDLNLSGNRLKSTMIVNGLYSLVKLNMSNNLISELDDLATLSSLFCLENLILVGNPVCQLTGYRRHTLQLFGERFAQVRLDMRLADDVEYMQLRAVIMTTDITGKNKSSGSLIIQGQENIEKNEEEDSEITDDVVQEKELSIALNVNEISIF